MRVVAKKILREFWTRHKEAEEQLKTWYQEASKANWGTPQEIKEDYAKASILKNSRAVFDICGGSYRLVVKVNYSRKWVFIRFIGTHSAYNKIDAETI